MLNHAMIKIQHHIMYLYFLMHNIYLYIYIFLNIIFNKLLN